MRFFFACIGFMIAGLFGLAGLAVMFAAHDAAGVFLLIPGIAIGFASNSLIEGPVRSFEEQFHDL